jgi:hypothetical protein
MKVLIRPQTVEKEKVKMIDDGSGVERCEKAVKMNG